MEYPGIHLDALKDTYPGAKYVCRKRQAYDINPAGHDFVISMYRGGKLAKSLQGRFTTYGRAEQTLIKYLVATDKFRRAIYPGSVNGQRIHQ